MFLTIICSRRHKLEFPVSIVIAPKGIHFEFYLSHNINLVNQVTHKFKKPTNFLKFSMEVNTVHKYKTYSRILV